MKYYLRRFAQSLNMSLDRYIPDSFLFAVLLTFIILIMGVTLAGKGLFQMIEFWYQGFWGFLTFGMQMVLMIVTGYTLATTPLVNKVLTKFLTIPKTSLGAAIFIFVITAILSFIHWGFGLIVGALLAPRLGKSIEKLDFKFLVASSYLGWCIGALGLSISIALLVNTPGHFLEKTIGIIPQTKTSLHPSILLTTIASIFIIAPALLWLLHPAEKDIPKIDDKVKARFDEAIANDSMVDDSDEEKTFATMIENSVIITVLLSLMGISFCVNWFATKGFDIQLNFFNFFMLFAGIALHGTPKKFYTNFQEGVKLTWGIVLQFPFYAGIQGMMNLSGLVPIMVSWFIAISTPETFPFWTYISSSIVNFFIPSSGGILLVQGPVMIDAGLKLGLTPDQVLRPFMVGEQISNLIQPFFAIPLLAMAGMKMKDIMGYCILFFLVFSVVYNLGFIIF